MPTLDKCVSCYPTRATTGRNIPPDVLLVAETNTTSYYITRNGDMLKVGDGGNETPAYMFELCRLTGDTEKMIFFRWKARFGPTPDDAHQQLDDAWRKADETGEPVTMYADGQAVVTVRPGKENK